MSRQALAGRTAIVTGGGKGLGLAIAQRLRDEGATVCSWDVTHSETTNLFAAEFRADVSDLASVEAALRQTVDRCGKPAILVNNAGIAGPTMPIWEYPAATWRKVVDVDLVGIFHCCKVVLPVMIEAGWGRVVNISSVAGKEGNATSTAYSAAKGGVIALTKAIAKELALTGILANAVTPGAFDTEIWEQTSEGFLEAALAKIPMGRLGRPEELAALVTWLCSDECSFSTGAVFDISGGRATH